MIYEVGKTYKAQTGEILRVDAIDPLKVYIQLMIGANGKDVSDEGMYIEGPAETFQEFMASTGCVEYKTRK